MSQSFEITYLAFPNLADTPAEILERFDILLISLLILSELRKPIIDPRLWNVRIDTAAVLMPETASDLDDLLMTWKHKIRSARELWDMKPEPVA